MNNGVNNSFALLPLGTVIKTKGYPGLLMIVKKLVDSKYYYRCIAYPDGYYLQQLYRDILIDDIECVLFLGYIR